MRGYKPRPFELHGTLPEAASGEDCGTSAAKRPSHDGPLKREEERIDRWLRNVKAYWRGKAMLRGDEIGVTLSDAHRISLARASIRSLSTRPNAGMCTCSPRSEERRVGKECRSRWS